MKLHAAICVFPGVVLLAGCGDRAPELPPYKDPKLPVERRVEDLLGRMTKEEKFWQLFMVPGDLSEEKDKYRHGIFGLQMDTRAKSEGVSEQLLHYESSGSARAAAEKINAAQRYFVEHTRLGIPIIPFDEALHGLVREGATSFPQSIALAATWDQELVSKVFRAVALETRTRGVRQILSPVVNVATDARWGRVEETYGEDPYLSSVMGTAFVREFEKLDVITTPKHFVANHGDGGRDSYPAHWNERMLEETYFPPFKACFAAGGSRSVMTAYTALDGRPCTANEWLLRKKLKGEWGFNGFVMSDAGSVGGMNDLHRTSTDFAESMKQAIENGQDVVLQTSVDHFPLFFTRAIERDYIDPASVDDAVRRVLRAKFQLGLFEKPYVDPEEAGATNGRPAHRELARQAAREAVVLLKNQSGTLPLGRKVRSIAVVGPEADELRLGGYSGPGIEKVSILAGIREKLDGTVKVNYAYGCAREETTSVSVPGEFLQCDAGGKTVSGLLATYWPNTDLSGTPRAVRVERVLRGNWTIAAPDSGISREWFSARWTGQLIAPATGPLRLGIEGNDGYRLLFDGSPLIDTWDKRSNSTVMRTVTVVKGRRYALTVEYRETAGFGRLKLVWDHGVHDKSGLTIARAVEAARKSDVVVVAAGLIEGESMDRSSLALPGRQPELIHAVASTGKPVIVVLVGGSAITMDSWLDEVSAILDVWYPGEVGGHAVADVLFGDYSPAGRLPITFPRAVGQVPLIYNHKPTGRLDRYYDLPGEPLFPFGFGLSYTTFTYGGMVIEPAVISARDSALVKFRVKNTGARDGDEVLQLYLRDPVASVTRPVIELKGFRRVFLRAGEEKDIIFTVTPAMLELLDKDLKHVVEPGEFRVLVGASSTDIRLQQTLTVR